MKIVNTQASNNRDLNYTEQSLTEIKIEIKNSTKIVGDFNTSLSIVNKRTRQMISEGLGDLENTINQLDQIETN